jgi:hypothetical protein
LEAAAMSKSPPPKISRRTVFAGAGAASALAAAAVVLPRAPQPAAAVAAALPEPTSTGGYQLTEHVKQYYATARV